jgi:hypothetical protein
MTLHHQYQPNFIKIKVTVELSYATCIIIYYSLIKKLNNFSWVEESIHINQ